MSYTMKKLLLTLILVHTVVFSLSSQIVEKTYYFDDPRFESYQGYEQVVFDGCAQMAEEGCPSMPWHPVILLLPYNTEAEDIRYEFLDFVEIEGEHQIYPYQQPRPLSETRDIPFRKDVMIYSSDEVYPLQYSSEAKTQFLNGYSVAMSGFTPVRYVPSTGKLSYASKVKVSVSYSASRCDKKEMLKPTVENEARVTRLAHNPDMLSSYADRGVKSIAGYELLVITPEEWMSHFDEYKAFYDARGLRTKIMSLEDIYSSFEGRDEQEKIRTFISHEYANEGVMMVLLGGDTSLVPYRGLYCFVNDDHRDQGIPADMYYVCLDGSWNDDNDDLWGEVGEDDLLPELAIARMPFSNETQLDNMLHKTLEYQANPVLGEFNDIVFGAEHLGDGYYGNNDLEFLIGEKDDSNYVTIGIPEDYSIHRYYATQSIQWSGTTFKNKINEIGGGYVYHVGHANADYVAGWYLSNITDDFFSKLDGVNHNYDFFHSHGCICGDFSTACILEKMVNVSTGFVAATGNSRYGWYVPWGDGPARHLNRELVDSYYNDRLQYIGTAFVEMKIMTAPLVLMGGEDNSIFRWNLYCINILGDVAVSPWLDEPFIPEIYYKPALSLGTTSTVVNIEKYGYPQSSFRCSLFYEDELLAFGMTDDKGSAKLKFEEPLNVADTMRLVVTGPNAWCMTYDVVGIGDATDYIYVDNIIINDVDGNSNGCLDYGENAKIGIELFNMSADAVNDMTVSLSTISDDMVEIIDAEVNVSSIGANASKIVSDAFSIKVKDGVKNLEYAYFTLTCVDGDNVYSQDFPCRILAPELQFVKAVYDDSNGNSDGYVDVGETVQLHITGKNKGRSMCDDIVLKAVTHDDNVIFTNGEKKIGRLAVGDKFLAALEFKIDDDMKAGTFVDIELVLSSGTYEARTNIIFTAGSVKEGFETADFSNLVWKHDDEHPWIVTDEEANSGVYSAQSAPIDDDEVSSLVVDIETLTDGKMSFYFKTSTEERLDFLAFSIDDVMMDRWSGENEWQKISYPLSAGRHTIEWFYDKSKKGSGGEDRCWIDDIAFPANTYVLNVESFTEKKMPEVYPNPADDFFRIEGEGIEWVDIYDMMGRKLMSHDATVSNIVDIADLPDGLYIVRILDEDDSVTVRKVAKR